MVPVFSAFRAAVADGNRNFIYFVRITLTDDTVLTITGENIWQRGLSLEDAVSNDSDFQVGAAIINKASIVINNMYGTYSAYDFRLASVTVEIALYLNGGFERVKKGVYIVNEAVYTDPLITLECYDNMSRFEQPYSLSATTYPATLATIVRDACADCDVTLGTQNFPNSTMVIPVKPDGKTTTYREVIAWAAQLAGCFARCNRNGALELKWFDTSGFADTSDGSVINRITDIFKPEVSMDPVIITGIKITVDAEDNAATVYQTGTNGYLITISGNPFITEDNVSSVLSYLGTQLIGLSFWKARVPHLADPAIEAGDTAVFWDRLGNERTMLVTKTVLTSSDRQITTCSAQDPARNSASRFSEVAKNYVQLRELIHDEKTNRQQAYSDLAQRINSTSGLYTTLQTGTSGTIFYLHNKPLLADSNIVWKMTSDAWAVSTDGGDTWNAGVTVDGTMIANILSTIGLDFGWGVGGQLVIKDANNNETFFADADTGVVRIKASSFSLTNGDTIQSIAEDEASAAVSALTVGGRNLVKNTLTPDVSTSAKYPRLVGQTSSTAVSVGTKTTAAHGMRITNTGTQKPYIRFGETSAPAGDPLADMMNGLEPGETYTWSFDASWKLMSSATGQAASGIRYLYASLYGDGNGITNVGQLSYLEVCELDAQNRAVDMSARVEFTFTIPTDSTICYLMFSCNASAVNYAAGDYLEMRNIKLEKGSKATDWTPAIEDLENAIDAAIDGQTQQDIFNKLTNNGTAQGIYLQNGQLYISFTYARGGTLKLGGANNGNGLMEIYDASNNLIGSWSKDGLVASSGGRITSANQRVYFDLDNNEIACTTLKSPTVPGAAETLVSIGESDQWTDENGLVLSDLTYVNIYSQGYPNYGMMISPGNRKTLIRSYRGFQFVTTYGTEPFVRLELGTAEFELSNNDNTTIRSSGKTIYFGYDPSQSISADYSANIYAYGNIGATGTKSRIVKTEDYGIRKLYCYETPTPVFGDIGEGEIGEDGLCYVPLDPIFAETIADNQYQVFLQAYGQGMLFVSDRQPGYFIVSGTPGLLFGWELKARQKDYDQIRLEEDGIADPHLIKTDYAAAAASHIAGIAAERTRE